MAKPLVNLPFGSLGCDLIIDPKTNGGTSNSRNDTTGRVTITVGIKDPDWTRVVEVTIHEALEMILSMRELRFREDCSSPDDGSDKTLFIMSHKQLEESIVGISSFVAQALPHLAKAFSKRHPQGKK